MNTDKLAVIIPSLDPDEKLLRTVESLEKVGFKNIILVNDGSKRENLKFFPSLDGYEGRILLHHTENKGKGAALKTAFKYVLETRPDLFGVITADGDGQHLAEDILACSEQMLETESVVLGCRDFSGEDVPKRSRFGNRTTSLVMRLFCGIKLSDTQTGLRAFPYKYLADMLEVKGERFEYETNMLISFKQKAIPYTEKKIETVYIEENKTSHFRTVRDSVRVYRFILSYCLSSVLSALVDEGAFFLFLKLINAGGLTVLISTVFARIISSLTNFAINKNKVFSNKGSVIKTLLKYYALAIPQMLVSAGLVYALSAIARLIGIGSNDIVLTLIKVVVDTVLFFASFRIQQNWVFADKKKEQAPKPPQKLTVGKIIKRTLLCIGSFVLALVITVVTAAAVIAHGPSKTMRNLLVLSAKQASATKWIPELFLDKATVDQIVEDSKKVTVDTLDITDVSGKEDEWDNAIDGMLYYDISRPTFKAYMLIVKDPNRLSVGVATENFAASKGGARFYEIASKYNAVALINAGEFADIGGVGNGAQPIGITYSGGKLVWNDGNTNRTYIGFDKNNNLIVSEGMTAARAEELGIRDMVAFQNNNVLIERVGDQVKVNYKSGDKGTAQRTAIGQRADGSVILLVTDGRTASSLGATPNDVISVMLEYGAVTAAMLDGGSSSMMYYDNYIEKLGVDASTLDQYQKMGLLNKYKAFVTPRRMPTYFIVLPEEK